MRYIYNGFIPQNVAPKGATKISVYNANGVRVAEIPLGRLAPPNKTPLFSFGLLSDLHLDGANMYEDTGERLRKAMTFFEDHGCAFCCHAGDMTNVGFYTEIEDEYGNKIITQYNDQMQEYKDVIDSHKYLPVYGVCGNHESYYKSITENLTDLKYYTGRELCYTLSSQPSTVGEKGVEYPNHHLSVVGDHVFIFIGQPASYETISKSELQWLYERLEENRDKMCHIFLHVFPPNDSGNPKNCYAEAVFGGYAESVKNLLSHYKNTILYHGHSHTKFICQELDETANYTKKNGFRSLHIPSSASSRDIALQSDGTYKRVPDPLSSQGYLADVYEDCIVFNGIEFNGYKVEPLGTFKIDTTLQTVEANTFTDHTGTIKT